MGVHTDVKGRSMQSHKQKGVYRRQYKGLEKYLDFRTKCPFVDNMSSVGVVLWEKGCENIFMIINISLQQKCGSPKVVARGSS